MSGYQTVQAREHGSRVREKGHLGNIIRCGIIGAAVTLLPAHYASADPDDRFQQILPFPTATVSTIPSNGDVNPYGVAFVPKGFRGDGMLAPGDILVSNFNNAQNIQGTGTTIVKIAPSGQQSLFFQGTRTFGLEYRSRSVKGRLCFGC